MIFFTASLPMFLVVRLLYHFSHLPKLYAPISQNKSACTTLYNRLRHLQRFTYSMKLSRNIRRAGESPLLYYNRMKLKYKPFYKKNLAFWSKYRSKIENGIQKYIIHTISLQYNKFSIMLKINFKALFRRSKRFYSLPIYYYSEGQKVPLQPKYRGVHFFTFDYLYSTLV